MTLRGGNRIRQTSRKPVVGELEAAEAGELADSGLTAVDIERRADEIYLSRNGAPGDALADWLQAERELRGGKATARPE